MKKRILSLLLVLVMLLGMLPTVALAADGTLSTEKDDDGTEYYLIYDASDLAAFRTKVHNASWGDVFNARLKDDVTLSGEWEPIGKPADWSIGFSGAAFNGIFDGEGHTVSGLSINYNGTGSTCLGLFGDTNAATIRNLTVNGNITVTLPEECKSDCMVYAGGVVGQAYLTTLEAVASHVNVTCTNNGKATTTVGGLIGNGHRAKLSQCANYGTIQSADVNENSNAGGLTGILTSSNGSACEITNSERHNNHRRTDSDH